METDVLRREDRLAYDGVMPPRRRRGRNSAFDWNARDLELHAAISEIASRLGEDAASLARILRRCGKSTRLFEKAKGRLPWSQLVASSIVENWRSDQPTQLCFEFSAATISTVNPQEDASMKKLTVLL